MAVCLCPSTLKSSPACPLAWGPWGTPQSENKDRFPSLPILCPITQEAASEATYVYPGIISARSVACLPAPILRTLEIPLKKSVWPRHAHPNEKEHFAVVWEMLMRTLLSRLPSPAASLPQHCLGAWFSPSLKHLLDASQPKPWLQNIPVV